MAVLALVGNGMKLRCRATDEVHPWRSPPLLCVQLKVQGQEQHNGGTGRLLGGKGKGSPPVQLPSAQPPGLAEARNVPLHPQRKKTFSFQSLKHPALGNRSTASLENFLFGNMLNLSVVHCCLLRFKQILYKCGFLPSGFIGDVL